jgi:hypothetical protein
MESGGIRPGIDQRTEAIEDNLYVSTDLCESECQLCYSVLRKHKKRGNDTNLDSTDSVSVVLSSKMRTKNMGMSFINFISVIKTMLFQRICLFE